MCVFAKQISVIKLNRCRTHQTKWPRLLLSSTKRTCLIDTLDAAFKFTQMALLHRWSETPTIHIVERTKPPNYGQRRLMKVSAPKCNKSLAIAPLHCANERANEAMESNATTLLPRPRGRNLCLSTLSVSACPQTDSFITNSCRHRRRHHHPKKGSSRTAGALHLHLLRLFPIRFDFQFVFELGARRAEDNSF